MKRYSRRVGPLHGRSSAFVLAFTVLGVGTIYLAKAAVSPNAKLSEGEAFTSSESALSIADASASNAAYIQFNATNNTVPSQCSTGGNYLWSHLELCGWPGPSNTGVPAGTTLTAYTGPTTITTNNMVIDGKQLTGSLTINAQNVTIKNSLINYTGGGGGGSGAIKILSGASVTIDHVEVNGNSAVHSCVWHEGSSMTVTYLKCHDMEDAIFSWADTGNAQSGNNFTVEHSYIYNFNAVESNGHFDGYQTEGAANGIVRHNTIAASQDNTSAIAIWNGQKNTDNILVDNNLLKGGGFTAYAQDYSPSEANPAGGYTMTNIRFTNNKFSNIDSGCVGAYGVWFFRSSWTYQGGPTGNWGTNGNTRSGNTVLETGASVDNSNPTANGALCS